MSRKLILSVALSGLVSTAMAQTTVAPAIPREKGGGTAREDDPRREDWPNDGTYH